MPLSTELRELLASGFGAVYVKTEEPQDATREVYAAAEARGKSPAWAVHRWDCDQGYTSPEGVVTPLYDPSMAIQHFGANPVPGTRNVLVMRNLHLFLDPQQGAIAMLIQALDTQLTNGRAVGQQVVIMAPVVRVPIELTRLIALAEHSLPTEAELLAVADKTVTIMPTDDSERGAIARAGRGLSRVQMEDAVALSAYRHRAIRPSVILDVKTDALKKSGLLSLYHGDETFDDLGGLDHLKDFTLRSLAPRPNRKVRPNGVLLTGIPGCLSGDTIIHYSRGCRPGGRPLKLSEFEAKFNGRDGSRFRGPDWDLSIPTFVHSWNPETGTVFYNRVVAVWSSGRKHCIRVQTRDSGSVTLTIDHPVLNAEGVFVRADSLKPGDGVLVRGDMKARPSTAPEVPRVRHPRMMVEGLKFYPNGYSHKVHDPKVGKTYDYPRMRRARLVVEAKMNGVPYEDFVACLKTDEARSAGFQYLPKTVDVHHLNENCSDDRIDNLVVMQRPDHLREHNDESKFNVEYTRRDVVVSVDQIGEIETFDVEMGLPASNLVVNDGVIVHNCGKSHFCKALGNQIGWPTVRLDIRGLMGSLVGQTEERLRSALAQIDAMDESIVHVDEVEKALAGGTSAHQGDNGVSAGILGTILEWMADRQGRAYVVMTCNDIEVLPPPLLRPGRLDGIFFFDYPDADQRSAIWDIHIAAYGLQADQVRPADEDWTGAEIKGACNMAALLDIPVAAAAMKITNVKNTASARMAEMRRLADGRYLSTDHDGLFRDERNRRSNNIDGPRRAVGFDS